MYTYTFLLLIALSHNAVCLQILGIVSLPLRSHYMAFKPLFRELANRGHNVTVINNYPDDEPQRNLKFVNLNSAKISNLPPLEFFESFDSRIVHHQNFFKHLTAGPWNAEDCKNLFVNELLKEHLALRIKYDVIFVEQFMSDCGLVYAAAFYDAPIIGITSHVLLPWAYPRLGIPFDVAAFPFYFTTSGPKKSLYQKIEDSILYILFNSVGRLLIQRDMYEVIKHHLPNQTVDIEQVARERMIMMFVYQHFSITGARLTAPQVLEIGGLHVGEPKFVPEDIERFLSKADHGAIYFSFGSNLATSSMSKKKLHVFLEAFKKLPQKVLWKWENESFPVGHDNVYTKRWFPQLDVLCHPKVVLFISHGGMLSISEAAHCGKPMLVVPFFGDQFTNAASVITAGFGNMLMFEKIDVENLVSAVNELTSEKMQQSARNVSKLWHDRPQKVMDSAIYWTEYVARHGTAPPSLQSKFTSTFESSLIDVYATFITLAVGVLAGLYLIFKLLKLIVLILLRLLTSSKKVKIQ